MLKAHRFRYEAIQVTSCPTCALPGLTGGVLCAFCGATLLKAGPQLSRLISSPGRLALHGVDRVLAVATEHQAWWAVQAVGGDEFSLVSFAEAGGTDVVLIDDASNVLASISPATDGLPPMLHDSADDLLAIVRSDGCGGLHALRPNGDVLFYLGASPGGPAITDILLTDAGAAQSLVLQFALMVTLRTQQATLFNA